ncbi:MAG: Fe-S cluster assembly protein SufB [Mycoplasma sp.]
MNKFGLSADIIKQISDAKHEDNYMLELRLKAFDAFNKIKNPKWTNDIDEIDYDSFIYFIKNNDGIKSDWNELSNDTQDTFKELGVIEAEEKYLDGISTQVDSETIYHKHKKELDEKGVIFCDTNTAYNKYPEIFKKYFNKCVPFSDNKFAALNTAVWSGGSFIYVPKNTHLEKPLQSYFRINSESIGQFERTLIIVDEGASLHYIEGCTAPIYTNQNLHAAVVEIYVEKNAKMKYTTIQNWSDNVLNYVTKRALVKENGTMTWIDGNIGSKHNIKFPACVLVGEGARGNCISVAIANSNIIQDTGAKMIHLAPNTKSNILSKSIGYKNSKSIFRGFVEINEKAHNSTAKVQCDTLLVDQDLISETIPYEKISNNTSTIEHEATISSISDQQLEYLMSRGITKEKAEHLIVLGFIDIFSKELPMEYAVELNRLLKI